MFSSIERIQAGAVGARLPELVERGRPAIIDGMFLGRSLEQIRSRQKIQALLGETNVSITRNYTSAHLDRINSYRRGRATSQKGDRIAGTFSQYLKMIAHDPASRYMICEEPTPEILLDGLNLSDFGVDTIMSGCGDATPLNPAPPTTAFSLVFVANGGNSSDLHADRDGRDVLLYQGFGCKRVVLFPSDAAPRLNPVANFSTVPLARMNDAERSAFLAYAGGVEYLLQPGEAVFMPAFTWHHFDYLEMSMSVTFRFGGIDDVDALGVLRTVHLDHFTQNIMAGTRDPARAALCRIAARRLCSAALLPYPSTIEKFRAMRMLAAECHRSTLLIGERPYLPGIVNVEDFLDGALSRVYSKPPNTSLIRRAVWRIIESVRHELRRKGRALAYWA